MNKFKSKLVVEDPKRSHQIATQKTTKYLNFTFGFKVKLFSWICALISHLFMPLQLAAG